MNKFIAALFLMTLTAFGQTAPRVTSFGEVYRTSFTPKDPYRILNGKANLVGSGWQQFCGVVLEVQPTGIRVQGMYGDPLKLELMAQNNIHPFWEGGGAEFFVEGYPYGTAENDFLKGDMSLCAKEDGFFTYTTTQGGSRTIHKLSYGKVYHVPQMTPDQIALEKAKAKAAADAVKKSSDAKALKFNQDAADKGDAYGLLRMGQRYRDGEGVEKDLKKAREYLKKSVAAGNDTARAELEKLPEKP